MRFDALELFEIVYEGLENQGFRRSIDDDGEPLTVSPNGDRDPIGHILGDEYQPRMQGMGVPDLCEMVLVHDLLISDQERFLDSLVFCHDSATSPEDMKRKLDNFANTIDTYETTT